MCLISMIRSMMLLLFLQFCFLSIWIKTEKSELLMDVFCVFSFVFTTQVECSEWCAWFQWFTQWCYSYVSHPVSFWGKRKEWIVDGCLLCAFFLSSSLLILTSVSVVFDFNASLNDIAPVYPMPFTVYVKRKRNEWFDDGCLLCVFFLSSLLHR